MGFFGKLIDAIRGGNKEELGKLKDEALDKMFFFMMVCFIFSIFRMRLPH